MKTFKLDHGNVSVLIDEDDYQDLSNYRWVYHNGYAYRRIYIKRKAIFISMHRHIMKLNKGDGLLVDHINQNKLDNRKVNLRITSRSINNRNRRKQKSKSEYRGVHQDAITVAKYPNCRTWKAMICVNEKRVTVGSFYTAIEAAKARDKYIIDNKLEGFPLNFEQQETV